MNKQIEKFSFMALYNYDSELLHFYLSRIFCVKPKHLLWHLELSFIFNWNYINGIDIIVESISIKGSQLGAFFPYAIVYCYHEFKLRYLKNKKLFSIRVKELFKPIVLRKKKATCFALFKSIFLRNRSLSINAMWFYSKKCKIGKGNLYLTEKQLSWNKMCCAADNHNYMCHTCAKELFRFELELSSYWQNIKFSWNCPKFHIFT